MSLCHFSLIALEVFRLTNRHKHQFESEAMTNISSTKETTPGMTLRLPE